MVKLRESETLNRYYDLGKEQENLQITMVLVPMLAYGLETDPKRTVK